MYKLSVLKKTVHDNWNQAKIGENTSMWAWELFHEKRRQPISYIPGIA